MSGESGKRPAPTGLSDLIKSVARISPLTEEEERNLATYRVSDCDSTIQKTLSDLNVLPAKLSGQTGKLLGDLVLLLHFRSRQQEVEFSNRIDALTREKTALEDDVHHLQGENADMQRDIARLQHDNIDLKAEVEDKERDLANRDQSLVLRTMRVDELEKQVVRLQMKDESEVSIPDRRVPSDPNLRTQVNDPTESQDEEDLGVLEQTSTPRFPVIDRTPDYHHSTTFAAPLSSETSRSVRFAPPPPFINRGVGPSGAWEYPYRGGVSPRSRPQYWPHHSPYSDPHHDPYHDPYAEPINGLHIRRLESLARDIDRFDPDIKGADIDTYLRELDYGLRDVPQASTHEKTRLIWKTTTRQVRDFMELLPPDVRYSYVRLRSALREEYGLYADQTSAALDAFSMKQRRDESPRSFFNRLRSAYFQGRHEPGLEDLDQGFKSLFLHNLHDSIRYDVSMRSRAGNFTMQEAKKYAQMAWETRHKPHRRRESDMRESDTSVYQICTPHHNDLVLEGDELPQPRQQGGRPFQRGGTRPPPSEPTQPKWQPRSPPKGKFRRKAPVNPISGDLPPNVAAQIKGWITDAFRGQNGSHRPSDPPGSGGEPDPNSTPS